MLSLALTSVTDDHYLLLGTLYIPILWRDNFCCLVRRGVCGTSMRHDDITQQKRR